MVFDADHRVPFKLQLGLEIIARMMASWTQHDAFCWVAALRENVRVAKGETDLFRQGRLLRLMRDEKTAVGVRLMRRVTCHGQKVSLSRCINSMKQNLRHSKMKFERDIQVVKVQRQASSSRI